MPIYEYRCSHGHVFEELQPIRSAATSLSCPTCRTDARRILSAPNLAMTDPARRKLVEQTRQTAERPQVVSSLPAAPSRERTPISRNPLHAKLPRP